MLSVNTQKTESSVMVLVSWEYWALKSFRCRLFIWVTIAALTHVLVWALWSQYVPQTQRDSSPWSSEAVTEAEFELASTAIAQSPHLHAWIASIDSAATASTDLWLDIAVEANRMGLTILEPKNAMLQPHAEPDEHGQAWVVTGSFASVLQWVTNLSAQSPMLITSFSLESAEDDRQVLLKVNWLLPTKELTLASSPSTTFGTALEALQQWHKTQLPLLQRQTWPTFEGLETPLGLSSMSQPWPEPWELAWQQDRQHILANTPLGAMRWRGALMSRGQAVALVEVGSEVWTVERGDALGQGRYRVVHISVDHMVLQQSTHGEAGRVDIQETILGAYTERQVP